jgi:Fe(3+) dicitrate transport protein
MFDKPATVADVRDSLTGNYTNRQVDIDLYNSFTSELRLKRYFSKAHKSNISFGAQFFHNNMFRRQQGKGTQGDDYDLTLIEENWGRSLNYLTRSASLFAEATIFLKHNLLINAGARGEFGQSKMIGLISYYPEDSVPITIQHRFPLFGAGFQYDWRKKSFLYGGISQGYRPVLLKDIVPGSVFERTDPCFRHFSHNIFIT